MSKLVPVLKRRLIRIPEHRPVRWYIYALVDAAEKVRYVGRSTRPKTRLREHWSTRFALNTWNRKLRDWLAKLKQPPALMILQEGRTKDWNRAEMYWIEHFKNKKHPLFNIIDLNVRAQLSAYMKGRTVSAITKERVSATLKERGIMPPPHAIRKAARLRRLHGITKEHARNISLGQRGRVLSAETRARISLALRGRKIPAEVLRKRSATTRGRKLTVEHRAKLSKARLAYFKKKNGR